MTADDAPSDPVRAIARDLHDLVSLIELRLRAAGGAEPFDLDGVDEEVRNLAVRAERGRATQALLLSADERTAHTNQIKRCQGLLARVRRTTEVAMGNSATLADTAYGTAEHTRAVRAFQEAITTLDTDRTQLASAELAAAESARALEQDNALRRLHGKSAAAGETAVAALDSLLRDRISTAIARGALLPVWFTIVMGHHPPAENTDQWVRTATSLLVYRLTYAVTDPLVALGPPADADTRRAELRDALDLALRELRTS